LKSGLRNSVSYLITDFALWSWTSPK